jgi:FKBP-type peptidyl-prolyl cis-trans isomerase (trigger factor)
VKPDIPLVLEDHATRLFDMIMPKLSGFEANSVAMMSFMLKMVAEEWDRGAARRVEENRAIRQVFRDALPVVTDTPLKTKITKLAQGVDEDFSISALDAANDALRSALTTLHAHVETLETAEARQVEDAIWAELRCSVERRRVGLANF